MGSGWLQRAQSVFGRREEPPQPFSVTCECGAMLQGIRADAPQRAACRQCGITLFVLPSCPYPLPASWRREELEPPPPPSPKRAKKAAAGATFVKPQGKAATNEAMDPPAEPPKRRTEPRQPFLQRLQALLSPLRLIAAALFLTVFATVFFLIRGAGLEQARRNFDPALERANKAFEAHDFVAAAQEFGVATAALDRLGRHDAIANRIRQRRKESVAAAGLLTSSFVDSMIDLIGDGSTETVAERFERQFQGQWLFFDTNLIVVEKENSTGKESGLRVETPLPIGAATCLIQFAERPGEGWPRPKADGLPQRAIFAAQLQSLTVQQPKGELVVTLRHATAVLWTSAEAYAGLLPTPTDEEERRRWEDLLNLQRSGIEKQGTAR